MSEDNTLLEDKLITINLSEWVTQKEKAASMPNRFGTTGVSDSYISKLIKQGKLEVLDIPELNLKLVKR